MSDNLNVANECGACVWDAEFEKLKENFDGLKNVLHDTQKELSAANAACAIKDAALLRADTELSGDFKPEGSLRTQIREAISASPQQVSEWERKQLEPLRAQVAMWTAIAKGLSFGTDWNSGTHANIYRPKLLAALSNTQAAAEQFIAECEQRGAVKALEDAAAIFDGMEYGYEVTEHGMDFPEDILRREILMIRANLKKAG